jgi:hypothetical protein
LLNWKERRKEKRSEKEHSRYIWYLKKNQRLKGKMFNCTKSVKLTVLVCSLCNKLFHKKCVPHHHKMQVPEEEEEEDSYVCCIFLVSRQFL